MQSARATTHEEPNFDARLRMLERFVAEAKKQVGKATTEAHRLEVQRTCSVVSFVVHGANRAEFNCNYLSHADSDGLLSDRKEGGS